MINRGEIIKRTIIRLLSRPFFMTGVIVGIIVALIIPCPQIIYTSGSKEIMVNFMRRGLLNFCENDNIVIGVEEEEDGCYSLFIPNGELAGGGISVFFDEMGLESGVISVGEGNDQKALMAFLFFKDTGKCRIDYYEDEQLNLVEYYMNIDDDGIYKRVTKKHAE